MHESLQPLSSIGEICSTQQIELIALKNYLDSTWVVFHHSNFPVEGNPLPKLYWIQCCCSFGRDLIDLVMNAANLPRCKGILHTSEFEHKKLLEVIRRHHKFDPYGDDTTNCPKRYDYADRTY